MNIATATDQTIFRQSSADQATGHGNQDFLLFYPSASGSSVQDAIHALYYLPKEYKLVVGKDASLIDGHQMTAGDDYLMDRILFDTNTEGTAEDSPFSYASAVIYGEGDPHERPGEPHIVVSTTATSDIEGDTESGFTVAAGNPEALASAAMMISKGRLALA